MKLTVHNTTGKNSTITVSDQLFGQPENKVLLSQVVRIYLSRLRQGTSKAQTRADVTRTTKKWFKQKGTGNARHGSRKSNIFVGGGAAHAPDGRSNWNLKISKVVKNKSLVIALSAQAEHTVVCSDIEKLDGKASSGARLLKAIAPDSHKILVVADQIDDRVLRSLRNLEQVVITRATRLNTLEVFYADTIVFTKKALDILQTRLGIENKLTAETEPAQPVEVSKKVAIKKTATAKTATKKTKPKSKKVI